MPIHDPGYREWHGVRAALLTRWMVVAEIGIRRAWLSMWLRRMMFFAWMPAALMGFLIFVYEQASGRDEFAGEAVIGLSQMLLEPGAGGQRQFSNVSELVQRRTASPGTERHLFWSALLLTLFRRSQPFILIPMIGVIVPPLISQDFRSRAFLLYFSRPLTRMQYILGKAASVMFFLLMITLVPAMLLFLMGVLLSPDLSVLSSTWDLPLKILLVSLMIVVPCTLLSLMLSSLTTESRYASFGWFAIWILGFLTYAAIMPLMSSEATSLLQCVSLFHVFSDVAAWILDTNFQVQGIEMRLILLGLITVLSAAVLYRRVSAPLQI
ncbi:MAG: hypothetical protein RLZZ232_255 [Planctomycetota bacterium]